MCYCDPTRNAGPYSAFARLRLSPGPFWRKCPGEPPNPLSHATPEVATCGRFRRSRRTGPFGHPPRWRRCERHPCALERRTTAVRSPDPHSRTVQSLAARKKSRDAPSGERLTLVTLFRCPWQQYSSLPRVSSHKRTIPSWPPVSICRLSVEKTAQISRSTGSLRRCRSWKPGMSQMRTVLSQPTARNWRPSGKKATPRTGP